MFTQTREFFRALFRLPLLLRKLVALEEQVVILTTERDNAIKRAILAEAEVARLNAQAVKLGVEKENPRPPIKPDDEPRPDDSRNQQRSAEQQQQPLPPGRFVPDKTPPGIIRL